MLSTDDIVGAGVIDADGFLVLGKRGIGPEAQARRQNHPGHPDQPVQPIGSPHRVSLP